MACIRLWVALVCALLFAFRAASAPAGDAAISAPRVEPGDLSNEKFEGAFYAYQPTYAALGGGEEFDLKFQISFKLRLWDHTFFGYTQTSVWNLYQESSPFHDTSYRPSLFYYRPDIWGPPTNSLGLATGFEHESNGKAGPDSRSINIAFVRPLWLIGDREEYHWRIAPKLYTYLEKSDNDDIQQYRGYGDFTFALRHPEKFEVALTARQGTTSDHRSVLAEVSAPFKFFEGVPVLEWLRNFPGYLYLQAFSGYGETLLDYNVKGDTQIRIGIAASRDTWSESRSR